jgi:hypothetical protein
MGVMAKLILSKLKCVKNYLYAVGLMWNDVVVSIYVKLNYEILLNRPQIFHVKIKKQTCLYMLQQAIKVITH